MKSKLLLSLAFLALIGCNEGKEKKESQEKEITSKSIKVTAETFVRAESDGQFAGYSAKGGFGKFLHLKQLYSVENQTTIRGNRDTYYSLGVFDLSSPLTVTMPESGDRFQSLMTVSQDQSTPPATYNAGDYVFTQEEIGTRYVFLVVRTLINPNDPEDLKNGLALQDQVTSKQDAVGTLELPNWDEKSLSQVRDSILVLANQVVNYDGYWGIKENIDPDKFILGAAFGWGANPTEDAIYRNFVPEKNDGTTSYSLTVKDVPVDGFWSISLYNGEGFYEKNDLNIYTYNNITAEKNQDGTIIINFGGDPNQINYMPIVKDWNYIVRMYQPKEEVLNGSWKFPSPLEKE